MSNVKSKPLAKSKTLVNSSVYFPPGPKAAPVKVLNRVTGHPVVNIPCCNAAGFSGLGLSNADFSGVRLYNARFENCDLREARFTSANIVNSEMSHARMEDVEFDRAALNSCDFRWAGLRGASFKSAALNDIDFSNADLSGASFAGATFSKVSLHNTNLSGATGLTDPVQFLKQFDKDSEGIIVYKALGATHFDPPSGWVISPGSFFTEVVNPDRSCECGCGVNFGTLEFCEDTYGETGSAIWECKILWEDAAGIVVPYMTAGKARCSRLKLIKRMKT